MLSLVTTTAAPAPATSAAARGATRRSPLRGAQAAVWFARFFRDPVACLSLAYRRHGPITALGNVVRWQGIERQHVFALGPDCNRLVLGNPTAFHNTGQVWRGPEGSVFRRIRNGLTRMNGDRYTQQRQLMLPIFLKKAVDGYVPEMVSVIGSVLDERWQAGETVELYARMREVALRLASHILFGRENPAEALALGQLTQDMLTHTFSFGVWGFPFDLPGTRYRRMRQDAERVERTLLAMIERRRTAPTGHTDLLATFARAFDEQSVPMESAELIGQTAIMFAASYENVASTLTWALFLLAQHPRVMVELHAELVDELHGEPPTVAQLDRLPLLDAVVKETLRILPPVPFLARKVVEEVDLGEIRVGPRDRVVCSPYVTHHLNEIYAEPQRFLPRRWFDIKPGMYEYLPFGAGQRACIGKTFATAEIKVALAMILTRFRLTVQPGARIDRLVQVMMRPRQGLPMSIHRQDGRFAAVPVRGDIHDMVDLN